MTWTATAKAAYHFLVPDRVRYPIGHLRRAVIDRVRRWRTPGPPLPPRALLRTVQMTPWIREYLDVGRASAIAIRRIFEHPVHPLVGAAPDQAPKVLDFGCGLGRTLRFLHDAPWQLHGCDIEESSIGWLNRAYPFVDARTNRNEPPLPYPDAFFDGLFAVSVFTHFDTDQQADWALEVSRVVRPGGLAAITTMGRHALGAFPALATPANRRRLDIEGFLFDPGGTAGSPFNARGAFHTAEHLAQIFAPWFEAVESRKGGIDGFQDLHLLRRRTARDELAEPDANLVDRNARDA